MAIYKTYTADELLEMIKETSDKTIHVETTENLHGIPKNTKLWIGTNGIHISTYEANTENRNNEYSFTFDCQWEESWHTNYRGKFKLLLPDEPWIINNIESIEQSVQIQKILFDMGYKWKGPEKASIITTDTMKIIHLEQIYLREKRIGYYKTVNLGGIPGYKHKITASDFIRWYGEPMSEPTTKQSNQITNNNMGLQKLTNALRRMLNGDVQSQYKAGYRNGELELTDRGKNALLEMIAGEKEKELADDAREYIKEYEENKKKNSDEKK